MTRAIAAAFLLATLPLIPTQTANAQGAPQVAALGRCRLSGGGTISACRVAYRSFGKLDAARDNGVLVPTWLLGRSEDWIPFLGPHGYVDTTQFYVVAVDAFGNGRSSSPSNAPRDSLAFQELTIGDMVESQHRLLTERLRISHLHAVVGFSMGGMQALEWAVRYPTFVERVVSIEATPRIGAYERLLLTTLLAQVEAAKQGHTPSDSTWVQLSRILTLFLRTPGAFNELDQDSVLRQAASEGKALHDTWALADFEAQVRAILRHDISLRFNSQLSRAAESVRARVLLVNSPDDHVVTAAPAVAFSSMVHADTLVLSSPCGHEVFVCSQDRIGDTVRRFLAP